MRVLVTGASGMIGGALVDALVARGHSLVLGVRDPARATGRCPRLPAVAVDFARDTGAGEWLPRLHGVEVVVNCVGILREHGAQTFESIHGRGPTALFEACAQAGVRRVVQVSALGADAQAASGYHRSKHAADQRLAALPVDAVIVRPSLVFAPEGASTRLFARLAALPVLPLPGGGGQCVQPVHLDDLVDALVRAVEAPVPDTPGTRVLDVVGPAPTTLREYVAALRSGLGLARARVVPVPLPLVRLAATVGGRLGGLLDRETLAMLERGNCAPAAGLAAWLGRPPREPAAFIEAAQRAPVRTRARLDWLLPILRLAVAATWIVTGIVSLWVFPRDASLALLARTGLEGPTALAALHVAGWLDIVLGIATLTTRWRRPAYLAQVTVMLAYTAIITVFLPAFWWHPYGPVLKNLPLLAATWLLLVLDDPR